MKTQSVTSLPAKISNGSLFIIDEKNVSYLTHNYFKYPCRFIPQIPGWALENLLPKGRSRKVYDPFAGSGTTLVEAILLGHQASGADIDPLSRMLIRVKSARYTQRDIYSMRKILIKLSESELTADHHKYIPDLPNLYHFFKDKTVNQLAALRGRIEEIGNKKHREFFMVMFASVIRKASLTDDVSPKPYVSTKHPKKQIDWLRTFTEKSEDAINRAAEYSKAKRGKLVAVEKDARKSKLKPNSFDIAITSPPYINAFDYVRSLKLENYWLGLVDNQNIGFLRKNNVGTESLREEPRTLERVPRNLSRAIAAIGATDKRRSVVVSEFFYDMHLNLQNVHRLLRKGAKYVIVVADSEIRGVKVPTSDILIEIGKQVGFKCRLKFGYIIRNRYLRIPRNGRGGLMKIDWVIVLEKK